ncbi:MAG: preprotein translocase subunit SecG [Candidatus Coatesbacteria bacterium]|nr:preprotein translocase subunit SecG [Candidatus Coatesbacteria bacterium]
MLVVLIILHVLVSLALVGIILFQGGKGADLASVFGGGTSGTAFGVTGAAPFIAKLTTIVAVGFLVLCIALSYFYTPSSSRSVVQKEAARTEQPAPEGEEMPAVTEGASPGTVSTQQEFATGATEANTSNEGL